MVFRKILRNLLWISLHPSKKLLKVRNCCDEFEQVIGGCLIYIFNCMGESI